VRNGAGASSTSFWWRRCSEQSRVETTTTLPCWSARPGSRRGAGCRGTLDEALAATEGRHGLADRRVVQFGDLLEGAGDLQAAAAAAERGLDRDRQPVLLGELHDLVGALDRVGGARTSGAPARCAMWRAETLSPSERIAAGGGPIQISPASMTAWAKSAFSDRKP
jgi:hypothetical protein